VRVAEVDKVLAVFGKQLGIVDRPRSDIDGSTDESNDE
jgi:hypothetical protein